MTNFGNLEILGLERCQFRDSGLAKSSWDCGIANTIDVCRVEWQPRSGAPLTWSNRQQLLLRLRLSRPRAYNNNSIASRIQQQFTIRSTNTM